VDLLSDWVLWQLHLVLTRNLHIHRTSYDVEEKKHWLTVHKGDLVGRFLLQDNLRPAWNDNRSTPEKIQSAVDVMIEKIDEYNRSRGIEPQLNNDGK
jgi:hypothetical protein